MGQWLGPYSCLRGFQASLLTTLQFLLSQTTYFVGLCIIKTWAKLIHLKSVKVYIQTLHLHISSIASSAYIHTGVMVYIWEDIGMSRGHCCVHMLRSVLSTVFHCGWTAPVVSYIHMPVRLYGSHRQFWVCLQGEYIDVTIGTALGISTMAG